MRVFKEKAGVISKESVWVCVDRYWLYIADTYLELLKMFITEHCNDKHLVG
jgi:hypothetical protein